MIECAVWVVRNDEKETKMREQADEEKKDNTATAQQEEKIAAMVEKLEKEEGYGLLSEGRAC